MPDPVSIDDLSNPQFSPAAMAIMEQMSEMAPKALSIDAMVKSAEAQLDVPVFIDDYMLDNFDRFFKEGEENGPFTAPGRMSHFRSTVNLIMQRSRLEALFKRHPEIADVKIDRPIIIAGLPRSATTNLSNLMAADSALNSLTLWEASLPIPTVQMIEGTEVDDRAEMGAGQSAARETIIPYVRNMMDVGHDGTIEEILLLGMIGMPLATLNFADTPRWRHWFYNQMDAKGMYRFLKRVIQALQWLRGNEKRWVLKSPHHLAFLPAMHEVFPDASFIVTHRDPASSVVSNATQISYIHRTAYAKPNTIACFENAMDMARGMIGGLVRDIDKLDASIVHHIFFQDYMKDTMATLEGVYKHSDLEWNDRSKQEILDHIASHPRGRLGRIVYNPERDFGQSREAIRGQFQAYLDKFPQVAVEEKHG